jgi:hypothetical protein
MSTLFVDTINEKTTGNGIYIPGHVGQVVSVEFETISAFTSTSYSDVSGFSASITPASSSSKVLVIVSACAAHSASNTLLLRLKRGSTIIGENPNVGSADSFINFYQGGTAFNTGSRPFLDSPATSSSVTYQIQARVDAATGYLNRHNSGSSYGGSCNITLMEIAQ